MPQVLDYASPQTNRRRRWSGDTLVVVTALSQLYFFHLCAGRCYYRAVPGSQWTLFAWAWRFSQGFFVIDSFNFCLSFLLLIIAIFFPAMARSYAYKGYLLATVAIPIVPWLASSYLMNQLPGVWASLLYDHAGGYPDDSLILLLLQPTYALFLTRLALPEARLDGAVQTK